jgi:Protein of unknown function (DUF2752)
LILCKKMSLRKKRNSTGKFSGVRFRDEPYLILNTFFAGVVIVIIIYSGIFSPVQNNYPVVCIHEKITGEPCFSCGLSHSFSLIVRGRIGEAYQWNIYGMRVFLFFISQLVMRIVFSLYYLQFANNRKQVIIIDSIGSAVLFLITFWPFLESIVKGFLKQV